MSTLYFITHPQVVVDPAVPVPRWALYAVGLARMTALLGQPWVPRITALFAGTERKAMDGAGVLGRHLHPARSTEPCCTAGGRSMRRHGSFSR